MTDTFLPWLDVPNMRQNSYLSCSVSGLPNNVPAIPYENGENQEPLRSLGYLLEIVVKMYQHPFHFVTVQDS